MLFLQVARNSHKYVIPGNFLNYVIKTYLPIPFQIQSNWSLLFFTYPGCQSLTYVVVRWSERFIISVHQMWLIQDIEISSQLRETNNGTMGRESIFALTCNSWWKKTFLVCVQSIQWLHWEGHINLLLIGTHYSRKVAVNQRFSQIIKRYLLFSLLYFLLVFFLSFGHW